MIVARFFNAFGLVAFVPESCQAATDHFELEILPPEIADKIAGNSNVTYFS